MIDFINLDGNEVKITLIGTSALTLFNDFVLRLMAHNQDIIVESLGESKVIRLDGNTYIQRRFIIDFVTPINEINLDSDNVVT